MGGPQGGFEKISPIKTKWICSTNHQKTSVTKCSNTIDPSKLKRHGTHAYRTSINAIPKRGAILRRIEGGHIFLFCSKPKLQSVRPSNPSNPSNPANRSKPSSWDLTPFSATFVLRWSHFGVTKNSESSEKSENPEFRNFLYIKLPIHRFGRLIC